MQKMERGILFCVVFAVLAADTGVQASSAPIDGCPACTCACAPVEEGAGIPIWMSIAFGLVLLFLSGCFSGLTLGLLGLDNIALKAIAEAPEQEIDELDSEQEKNRKKRANADKKAALKIIPLRRRGNLLLCTLLLGNVMVNVMIPILLADLTGGLFGFVFSTVFIVIFGEIVPQATCSRYALQIGAMSIPLVTFFKCILLPMTIPIAWVLDRALGADMGQLYDQDQLGQLMLIHLQQGHLEDRECRIIQRGLQLAKTAVAEVMTYQRSVYFLDAEDQLTEDKLIEIWQKGHSRIPVIEQEPSEDFPLDVSRTASGMVRKAGEETSVDAEGTEMSPAYLVDPGLERRDRCIGLLYAKDLITVRAEDKLTVRQVLNFYSRGDPLTIHKGEKLDKVLDKFRRKKVHLALVQEIHSRAGRDPFSERVGIVTLEDVLEHLVGEEFVDEHDVVEDVSAQQLRRTRRHNTPLIAFRKLVDHTFTPDEAMAVAGYLLRSIPACFAHLDQVALAHLLREGEHTHTVSAFGSQQLGIPPADSAAWIYKKGKPLNRFTFVLSGGITVITGDEEFRTFIGPYQHLGSRALDGGPTEPLSDFDAYVQDAARLVQLDYEDMSRLTRDSRSQVRRLSSVGGAVALGRSQSGRQAPSIPAALSPTPKPNPVQSIAPPPVAPSHFDPGGGTTPVYSPQLGSSAKQDSSDGIPQTPDQPP
eukprot:Hpha_TRINITY_DN16185_c1_g1::TRINITY_DN16185_c1_g1_i1::g.5506::m.5506/K16302/CNNM; metal transporter CNNM